MAEKKKKVYKIRIKRGDKVKIIAGKDKGKEGKVLVVDREKNRVIVEGRNMALKHLKPNKRRSLPQGGITRVEASIHVSNVMLLYRGQTTRVGVETTYVERDGKKVAVRQRIAKATGEIID
ncbi:MAG: 50S ribosomal protein L24 [Clostridiales bacterium]|jgi:large subunit ribosomal protein L24|nr:50S ribosomal protein L24 [Clostridiales bacterium]